MSLVSGEDSPSVEDLSTNSPSKPSKRGQYFLEDELLSKSSLEQQPTIASRRKQTKPSKITSVSEDITIEKEVLDRGPMKIIKDEANSDDSDNLVIDTGSADGMEVDNDKSKEKPKPLVKNKRLSALRKSLEAEADLDTDEDVINKNKAIKKTKKRKRVSNSSQGSSEEVADDHKGPARKTAKFKKSPDKMTTPNKSAKGSPAKKVDEVENALEAMFAGLGGTDSEGKNGGKVKKESESSSPSKTSHIKKESESSSPSKTSHIKKESKESLLKPNHVIKKAPVENRETKSFKKAPNKASKSNGPSALHLEKDKKAIEKKKAKIYGSKLSDQDKLLNKFEGPFVRVQGDIASPEWSNVINTGLDQLSPNSKERTKGINEREQIRKIENFGPTCTLNPEYDAKKMDENWCCIFCKKSSHFKGLGDLFGPYFITSDVQKSPSKKKELAAKFIIGGDSKRNKKKRRSSESSKDQMEIWFHEDCLCWLPEVSLIGSRVLGLEDAVASSAKAICGRCKNPGATMACLKGSCKEMSHFVCATTAKWMIDEDNFETFCTAHF